MTKEAMIKVLRYKAEHIKTKIRPEFFLEVAETLKELPCEDCVSRAEAIKQARDYGSNTMLIPVNSIKALPSVTPTRKKGYWIQESQENTFRNYCKCSVCGKGKTYIKTPYCPNCGADMRGEKNEI